MVRSGAHPLPIYLVTLFYNDLGYQLYIHGLQMYTCVVAYPAMENFAIGRLVCRLMLSLETTLCTIVKVLCTVEPGTSI